VTVGALANILVIHDKLIRLIGAGKIPVGAMTSSIQLQGSGEESLHWNDAALRAFLAETVRTKFGVQVTEKNIKKTINGTSPTIGDLSIAISSAIQRQQRPRKTAPAKMACG
jgi:hypothetical protein